MATIYIQGVYISIDIYSSDKKSEIFPAFMDYVNVKKEKNCVQLIENHCRLQGST